jgi:hypothetical protein
MKLAALNEAQGVANAPLVSDDLMSELNASSQRTQKLPDGADRTQKLPAGADRTQKLVPDGDRTQKIAALDPAFRPEQTQILDSPADTTQRTDDSIRRLQEAKRILQKSGQK